MLITFKWSYNMEILVRANDKFRLSCDGGNNFIDIHGVNSEMGVLVNGYPRFHYIEIREKEGEIATFYLKKKSIKKDIDFGWWDDAEIIFTKNNVKYG